jgi:Helix-turn-helix domain
MIITKPLSLDEAAALLHMPPRSLRLLCKRKEISFTRVNYRNYLFSHRDIAEFLQRRHIKAPSVAE